jgi:DNA-binding response OmpR family regulator
MTDILLVDDNFDYLFLLGHSLTSAGYRVHSAMDGAEGCEILSSTDIDIIISDIRMPRLDGVKLHTFAREMAKYATTKFIFVSAYTDLYDHIPGTDPTIDFFVDKTTPLDDIVAFVKTLLSEVPEKKTA